MLAPRYKRFVLGVVVSLVLLLGIFHTWIPQRQIAPLKTGEQKGVGASCEGPHANDTLETIFRSHQAWLESRENPDDERVKICAAELKAELKRPDRRWFYLRGADLRGAEFQGADLRWADLRGADLREAKLQKAQLRCADLQGANLYGADLEEAHLWDANLQGSVWTGRMSVRLTSGE